MAAFIANLEARFPDLIRAQPGEESWGGFGDWLALDGRHADDARTGGTPRELIGTAFFWAMRRNMDATFYLDYFSRAKFAEGLEFRLVPNDKGRMTVTGYYLNEDVDEAGSTRYRFTLEAIQKLPNNWKLLANLDRISDPDYYRDFERQLAGRDTTGE